MRLDDRLTEFAVETVPLREADDRSDLLVWRPGHRATIGGETVSEFFGRVAVLCDEIVSRHLGSSVVIVTHAGVIDASLRWALGIECDRPLAFEFDVANASITEFEVWPRGRIEGGPPRYTVVRRISDARHLAGDSSDR